MKIQDRLRESRVIDFEGAKLEYAGEWSSLEPGDTYVAERNSGPKLLTVKSVNLSGGWVTSKESNGYSFDLHECVKVNVLL